MRNSNRIKFIRCNIGMTQECLASEVGVDRSLISKIETGESEGSLSTLRKIADVLGVSLAELLGETDEQAATLPKTG